MHKRKVSRFHTILLQLLLLPILYLTSLINAGASSTPKNLVNLYTPNDNINSTNSNQFQNEYQYRQSASKQSSTDRYKSPTSSLAEALFEHASNDLANSGSLDYNYQDGRSMTNVPECKGRLKLNGTRGFITDGPGFYQTNLQCIWLIDSGRDNATIRIQVHQFNTECNYDFLYIFDGDSIYSPLIATLSGDMKDFSNTFMETRLDQMISSSETNSTPNSISNISAKYLYDSRPFELKTNSGKAFVYFHSDTAQSMPGFYMTYSIDSCPLDCSNRGECDYVTLACRCNEGFYGEGCQNILCPNNCTSQIHGICDKQKSCICNDGFVEADCSKKTDLQTWESILNMGATAIPPRAFHQASIVDDIMWIFGGKSQVSINTNIGVFRHKKTPIIFSYDLQKRDWSDKIIEGVTGVDHLAELSGHSVVSLGAKAFIFGGIAMNNTILNTLTIFDTKTHSLTTIETTKVVESHEEEFAPPLGVVGHSANIIDGQMYVFLGYNPVYGYLNFAQKFNPANNSWLFIKRKGSSISGCIGHSSSFDPKTRLVYIYGGHNAHRSNKLYMFDPDTEIWTYLKPGPSPRHYHSSILINGQLLILSGNGYNIFHQSDQCFQQTYLTYDLDCSDPDRIRSERRNRSSSVSCEHSCWNSIEISDFGISKRYGHSVVEHKNQELILFGGFNGILMNDLRFMKIHSCLNYTSELDCVKPKLALKCRWDDRSTSCRNKSELELVFEPGQVTGSSNCTKNEFKALQGACEGRETCTDCVNTGLNCVWCGLISQCQYGKCKSSINKPVIEPEACYRDEFMVGPLSIRNITSMHKSEFLYREHDNELDCKLDNCYLCQSKPHCSWQNDVCSYNLPSVIPSLASGMTPQNEEILEPLPKPSMLTNSTRLMDSLNRSFLAAITSSMLNSSPYQACDVPCYARRSCNECTTTKCIWCSTTEQCIDSSAYFAYHSMGQCMHYVAHMLKCPVASCADIETCDRCLANPKCGWLNDISNTGKGRCIEGDSSGPSFSAMSTMNVETSTVSLNSAPTALITQPLLPNWFYTSCPLCQCNGHSYCKPNSGVCVQPCQDNSWGPHCDRCEPSFFGDPTNGGSCKPCRCNGHAQTCNRENGKCYCSTKGIIGHNCNKCDDKNNYVGDPSSPNNGTCYYNLTTDYQYTFNMSKPEDHFYSDINFISVPMRKDIDVDFSIACSRLALVNITSGTSYKNRRPIHSGLECGSFRLYFPHGHNFTDPNYSFFVHVYKFQTPFILQITFSQQRTFYLLHFIITFLR